MSEQQEIVIMPSTRHDSAVRAEGSATPAVRKNWRDLSPVERWRFVNAVKQLKLKGKYDDFVSQHKSVFDNLPSPAHLGPGFLPWHREFLLRFEIALREFDSDVSLPYWDWPKDNSWQSDLWSFMGGNGDLNQNDKVTRGPFAYNPLLTILWSNGSVTATTTTAHEVGVGDSFQIGAVVPSPYNGTFTALAGTAGNTLVYALATDPGPATVLGGTRWVLNILPNDETDPFLKRNPGSNPLEITENDVINLLKINPYDKFPWEDVKGFRPDLEGGVHSTAHNWVGGSMMTSCSPNDPVFWLHHCNIDRLWAQWQTRPGDPGWPYLPPSGTVHKTFSCSANSDTITVANAAGILSGVVASGPSIPDNTVVTAISGTTITLSQKTTGAQTIAPGEFAVAWLGHGLDDAMRPWGGEFPATPRSVLNHLALGYSYNLNAPLAAISWTGISPDGTLRSYWRVYGFTSGGLLYERQYDNAGPGVWIPVRSGDQNVSGNFVAAVWQDSGDSVNPFVHLFVVQESQMRLYIWNRTAGWQLNYTWEGQSAPHSSIAVVSWKNGDHKRLYFQSGTKVVMYRYDEGLWTYGGDVKDNRTLISAISWEDTSGAHIRVHVWNKDIGMKVLTSSDGNGYLEKDLP
jgi:hypothetical protein